MNDHALFMLGTPLGSWSDLASALAQRAPDGLQLDDPRFTAWHDRFAGDGGAAPLLDETAVVALGELGRGADAPWGGIDARACWTLEHLARRFPRARFIVFVESPAAALAAALAAGRDEPPEALLKLWQAGARRILHHAQRHPGRCLLIDSDEARRAADALLERCRAELGVEFADAPWPSWPDDPDALCRALAELAVGRERAAQALFDELQASCVPLLEGAEAAVAPDLASPAVELYRRLTARAAATRAELQQARLGAAAQAQCAQTELEAARAREQRLQQESDDWRAQCEDARHQSERLLTQLHQSQEELESTYLKSRDAEQQLDELRKQIEQTVRQKDDVAGRLDVQTRLAADRLKQIETHVRTREDLKKTVAAQTTEIERLTKQHADLASKLDTQSRLAAGRLEQIEQLAKTRDEQAGALQARKAEFEALTLQLSDAALRLEASVRLANERGEQVERQAREFAALQRALDERQTTLEKLQGQNANLTSRLETQTNLAADRLRQIHNHVAIRNEQSRQLTQQAAQLEAKATQLAEAGTRIAQLEQACLDGQARLDAAAQQQAALATEHQQASLSAAALQSELDELLKVLQRTQEDFERSRAALTEARQASEQQQQAAARAETLREQTAAENEQLRRQASHLDDEAKRLRANLHAAERAQRSLADELAQARREHDAVKNESTALQSQLDQRQKELADAAAQRQQAAAENEQWQLQTRQLREELKIVYPKLDAAERAQRSLADELALARREHDAVKNECAALQSQLDQRQKELADAAAQRQQAAAENEQWQLQTRQLREELKIVHPKLDAAEQARRSLADELALARREHDAVKNEGAALQLQLDQARKDLADAAAQRQQAAAENEQGRRRLGDDMAAARQELALLQQQVGHVQKELEQSYAECSELHDRVDLRLPAGADPVQADAVVLGSARDTAPHRDLDVRIEGLRHGERSVGRLHSRLVEHHGHAGLALFSKPGETPPLAHWQPSGHEGDADYMLFVPDDRNTHGRMRQLTTSDWLLVQGLAGLIERELRHNTQPRSPRWRAAAARLRQELAQLPDAFRHDAVSIARAGGSDAAGALDLSFTHVSCGELLLPALDVRWWPAADADATRLEILAAQGGPAPLASWPVADDGSQPDRLQIPVGRAFSRDDKRQRWASFTRADRALMLGLLEALPAALGQAPATVFTQGANAQSLGASAARLLQEAQRAVETSRLRRLARAVLGRQPATI